MEDRRMRNLLLATAAAAAVLTSVPAMAQVHVYGDEGGVRFGFGDRHDWRDRDHWREGRGAYADCRTNRERTVTPSGRVIITTRRICD
jgi:hypothetical protein